MRAVAGQRGKGKGLHSRPRFRSGARTHLFGREDGDGRLGSNGDVVVVLGIFLPLQGSPDGLSRTRVNLMTHHGLLAGCARGVSSFMRARRTGRVGSTHLHRDSAGRRGGRRGREKEGNEDRGRSSIWKQGKLRIAVPTSAGLRLRLARFSFAGRDLFFVFCSRWAVPVLFQKRRVPWNCSRGERRYLSVLSRFLTFGVKDYQRYKPRCAPNRVPKPSSPKQSAIDHPRNYMA